MPKLKTRVVVKGSLYSISGQEGIVVVLSSITNNENQRTILCKVRVGNEISDWIPYYYLETI